MRKLDFRKWCNLIYHFRLQTNFPLHVVIVIGYEVFAVMETLKEELDQGISELLSLWDDIGLDEMTQEDRRNTVSVHFKNLLARMINEEKGLKKKLVESLEANMKMCRKLSKEMGVVFAQPVESLVLIQLEGAMRAETNRLVELRNARLREASVLRDQDEELSHKLGMEPHCISSTVVPTTTEIEGLKDHITSMEEEIFTRLEQFLGLKDAILRLYSELGSEPRTEFEREVACEETDRFVLSDSNLAQVSSVLKQLKEMVRRNQMVVVEAVERMAYLYEILELDDQDKVQFLAENQGHSQAVIVRIQDEVSRLEGIKRANTEKFVNNLRTQLHCLWDKCFYSIEQRNSFSPLHSVEFSEEILEAHEAEVLRLKKYLDDNQELFAKVSKRQEVWKRYMDLESRAKDPTRLMNSRGNSLLEEERERKSVNRALPRVEEELQVLIDEWERRHDCPFLIEGVSFIAFIAQQKEDHANQLLEEKLARERAKKDAFLHETRYGARPSTPAKLKGHNSTAKTPRKFGNNTTAKTPHKLGHTPAVSRQVQKVSSAEASMRSPSAGRSPRAGRFSKGTSPRIVRGKHESKKGLKQKVGSSYGIKKTSQNKKILAAKEGKIKKAMLDENNYTRVGNESVLLSHKSSRGLVATVPDYARFKQGNMHNSTEAITPDEGVNISSSRSYIAPTLSSQDTVTPSSSSRTNIDVFKRSRAL